MHSDPTERQHAAETGCVAHLSAGGWGQYHRLECAEAPHRGDVGVRDVIHGPWRYLAAHWAPCSLCLPPTAASLPGADPALPTAA